MFKKLKVNTKIKLRDNGNFSIDINPINNNICYCQNNKCYLYSKDKFINENNDDVIPSIIYSGDTIISSKFTRDGKKLIISDYEYKISIYSKGESTTHSLDSIFEPGNLKSWKFSTSPNSNIIATGAYSLLLYDIDKKILIKENDNRGKYIYSTCFLNDNLLAIGNSNGAVNIFNLDSSKFVNKTEEHCLTVRALAYNKVKNQMYSASDDLHINIIDTNVFKVKMSMVGHKDKITALLFSNENNLLFSSSIDGTIRVWDQRENAKNIATLDEGTTNLIWDMTISNDGKTILYAGDQGPGAYTIV